MSWVSLVNRSCAAATGVPVIFVAALASVMQEFYSFMHVTAMTRVPDLPLLRVSKAAFFR